MCNIPMVRAEYTNGKMVNLRTYNKGVFNINCMSEYADTWVNVNEEHGNCTYTYSTVSEHPRHLQRFFFSDWMIKEVDRCNS